MHIKFFPMEAAIFGQGSKVISNLLFIDPGSFVPVDNFWFAWFVYLIAGVHRQYVPTHR